LFKIEKTEVQVSFDLTKRIDLRAANKALENLILAGGFDSFSGTLRSIFS
jgi:DNA polymerase III alpha subunit